VVWEIVGIVRGGRIAHSKYFPVGRVDQALRRLDELSAEGDLNSDPKGSDRWVVDVGNCR
jgi:hypothetical protein